jgi:hypothetical protein
VKFGRSVINPKRGGRMQQDLDPGTVEPVFSFDLGFIFILVVIIKYQSEIYNLIMHCYYYFSKFIKRRIFFDLRVVNSLAILGAIWWIIVYGQNVQAL